MKEAISKSVARLESQVVAMVYEDNKNTAHFRYDRTEDGVSLVCSTYNPKKDETFVMKTFNGTTEEDCLMQLVKYLIMIRPSESSYVVTWAKKGENTDLKKSYFYAVDVLDVLSKFYTGKMKDEYAVFSVEMNPSN